MLQDDQLLAQTFCPRGADIVLAQHLEHAGAHEAAPGCHADNRQGDDRQDQVQHAVRRAAGLNAAQQRDHVFAHGFGGAGW